MTPEPEYFPSPAAFRDWLAAYHAAASELWVGYHKVGTGLPSMTWAQSVDEALCYGWIDGKRVSVDEGRYRIRFTPRKKDSIWSTVNRGRMVVLTAEGRMQPEGLAIYEVRKEAKTGVYTYEQPWTTPSSRRSRRTRRPGPGTRPSRPATARGRPGGC